MAVMFSVGKQAGRYTLELLCISVSTMMNNDVVCTGEGSSPHPLHSPSTDTTLNACEVPPLLVAVTFTW